jgi:U3 small nucleolar RNA-associated protein 12
VGTKDGRVALFELGSGEALCDEAAHEGAVWSLAMRPDRRGFATGGADKTVKFWDFEVDPDTGRLGIVHTRTLKMADEVLCLAYSHAKEAHKLLLAVALLDCTVKIFFDDTLKFSLSLYGHKLPVMSIDISSDDTVIATASADKNVKLWGLDFGDCHKSIFAHADTVTCVKFVRGTHHLFTCGRDGAVKHWDGDSHDLILELKGHVDAAWCAAVSQDGDFVLTGGEDRSLRCWERGQDQVFLEEEEELRMEEVFEAEIDDHSQRNAEELAGTAGTAEAGESAAAGVRSRETLKQSERVMEAVDLADAERRRLAEAPETPPNPVLLGMDADAYVLRALRMCKAQDLEQALLVLPFHAVQRLFAYLVAFARKGLQPELTTRCACFLLKVHHNAVVANRAMAGVLRDLREFLAASLAEHQDAIGFNIAGLKMLQRRIKEQSARVPDKRTALSENGPGSGAQKKRRLS